MVSSATPTTIKIDVPPIAILIPLILVKTIGKIAKALGVDVTAILEE